MKKPNPAKDVRAFVETITTVDMGTPLYDTLSRLFIEQMQMALKGRICTPERMATLYPVFREINLEMDEINAEWESFERAARKRATRQSEEKSNA